MSEDAKDRKKPIADHAESPKKRMCLMCSESFQSTHSGERICQSCKGTAAWRNGAVAI